MAMKFDKHIYIYLQLRCVAIVYLNNTVHHGSNFALQVGSTNSEGERGALGSQDDRGGEWGDPLPSDSGVSDIVMSSLCGVHGGAPAENGFIVISADRLC